MVDCKCNGMPIAYSTVSIVTVRELRCILQFVLQYIGRKYTKINTISFQYLKMALIDLKVRFLVHFNFSESFYFCIIERFSKTRKYKYRFVAKVSMKCKYKVQSKSIFFYCISREQAGVNELEGICQLFKRAVFQYFWLVVALQGLISFFRFHGRAKEKIEETFSLVAGILNWAS